MATKSAHSKYSQATRHEWSSSAAAHPCRRRPFLPAADSARRLQHNSFLCWPALYENWMVIAHQGKTEVQSEIFGWK